MYYKYYFYVEQNSLMNLKGSENGAGISSSKNLGKSFGSRQCAFATHTVLCQFCALLHQIFSVVDLAKL